EAYLCHCNYCRRATGGVSIAFKNVPVKSVTWTLEPDWHQSSPIARRPFCSRCGTPLGFRYLDSQHMDLTVGSFDEPAVFRCTSNFSIETALPNWLDTSHLPGKRLDEYQPVVSRWVAATGKMPD
ncbi:MAG: GFA family protein, partial [Caulobacteraceae bacterium]|nr:GFA family protein [Caulobacteraceae bacterium]